jgi:hypothetical protein
LAVPDLEPAVEHHAMTGPGRVDTNNLRRIENLRSRFEKLRTDKIRAESEVERLELELDQARQEALATFGTDQEDRIQVLIDEARAKNTRLVDEFEALLSDIETRLSRLGDDR